MVLLRALGLVSLGWYGIVLFRVASSGPYLVLVLVFGLHMVYLFRYTRYCTILCVYLCILVFAGKGVAAKGSIFGYMHIGLLYI